jgi:hypothetical protein
MAILASILILGSTALGVTVYSYDFEDPPVAIGNLIGQDSWVLHRTGSADPYVVDGSGEGGNNHTQVVRGYVGIENAQRAFDPVSVTPIVVTDNDYLTFQWDMRALSPLLLVNLHPENVAPPSTPAGGAFRIGMNGGKFFAQCGGNQVGDTFTQSHWYQIKAVADMSDNGRFSLYYRRLSSPPETEFTLDSVIQDVYPGTLSPDVNGEYQFYYYTIASMGNNCYLDNFVLDVTPIPSPYLLGDANQDGVVSADDFASIQSSFGNTGDPGGGLFGDANHDGVVSADDFASIQSSFGNTSPEPAPEPATLGLLAMGLIAVFHRRSK